MLAKASKWQIGAGGVEWLGLRISSGLGLAWVPQPKALKAIGEIQSVLDGTCKAGDYRKLIGLLEHVRPAVNFSREMMDYLYAPMQQGAEVDQGPDTPLLPDGRRDGYLRKWVHELSNSPGASLLAWMGATPPPSSSRTWRLRADAALDEELSSMGGCVYGNFWQFQVRRPPLTIPVLELMATCINFITFAPTLQAARCAWS